MIAAGLALSSLGLAAQERPAASATTYRAPRTPDGAPDLQGFWTNLTYTPFERPRELADKPFYTEQEAINFFNRSIAGSQDQIVHYVNGDFGATPVQTGARPNRRTSLVIDPADGRIPALTPEAQKLQQALLAADKARGPLAQTWRDDRGTVWCVFHDRAVPSVVAPYGSNYHIVQSKDWIVMTYEWNTERRLIALDGRPHAPATFRTYAGDARGHWEGDTLVVETTNFTPKRVFLGSPGTPPATPASPALTLVERFTRTADDTLVDGGAADAPDQGADARVRVQREQPGRLRTAQERAVGGGRQARATGTDEARRREGRHCRARGKGRRQGYRGRRREKVT
jgi:hypothetical protein